ncbi:DNA topoisomerase 2-alpha, partial [Bienertia sinuspersici]
MRVIMMVGVVIITLIMLPIRPSSAQTAQNMGCVRRISYCLNQADDILVCCPTLKDEMENERECFCSIMDVMLKNATTASAMARFLSHCSVTDSMETICSGSTPSSPSLPAAPSNTTSSSPSQPTTPKIKEEIENARECFCVAKDSAREDPSAANGFSKIFTMCSIPGSLDTLCPG